MGGTFAEAVKAVADTVGSLRDESAQEFLQRFPLELCFRELSRPGVTPELVEQAAGALAKLFDTQPGGSLLPSLPPYAAAALQSPSAPLRRLAVQQLGRLLASQAEAAPQCLDLLLTALQDDDVRVAAAAEAALKTLGRPQSAAQLPQLLSPGHPWGQRLAQLASCDDPLLRMRSLTLLVAAASQSPAAALAVRRSGLLEPLLRELQQPDDLLSCMAALQLLSDAAQQCDSGMAAELQEAVMPRLEPLLNHPEPVLQSGALRAAASLLGASLEAAAAPMAMDGPGAAANGGDDVGGTGGVDVRPLLSALKGVLDVSSAEEVAQEVEEAAMDAVSILGLHSRGAEALLADPSRLAHDVAYKALGRPTGPPHRIAALHCLAAVAGAERSGRSGKLLGEAAEAALRVAVFEGAAAAWSGATPADVFQQQLEQPFVEQRAAVYRCLAALAARDWLAGQVCAHAALLDLLLDARRESGKQGCEWRHACVCALSATIADVAAGGLGAGGPHHAALMAAAERVQAAVRAGPYGSGVGPQEQQVATMSGV